MPDINPQLLQLLGGTFVALTLGTLVRIVALRGADPDLVRKRMGSLKVWWVLTCLMSVAVVLGRPGIATILALAGCMGLRELLKLIDPGNIDRSIAAPAFGAVILQFVLAGSGAVTAALSVVPALSLLVLSTMRLLQGQTTGYLRANAGLFWSVMLLGYCLSHAVLLTKTSSVHPPVVGEAGWFLFVVIITEADDIAQALVGRRIGRRRITPRISPNKSWEGFLGGVVTSVVLSAVLAPWLTTFPPITSLRGAAVIVSAGVVIVVAAFLGDINMSAVKRDAGVKDGSTILPGMGGIIDRIDSLTFTAPAMFWFLRCVV
ncbi:MAG: phosphatidate cytidylyltransferase [Planctomycetaceae bacterium]|nr:phosphatidate cytidylyltransferase [Planctomycetaceae bacterium]